MQWALLAVVILGLFLISGRYPKTAFSILGALVLAAATYVLLSEDKFGLKELKIPTENIAIENTAVVPAYANSYRISGRIANQDQSIALKEVSLKIEQLDCKTGAASDCQIVGQALERLIMAIPPGQARDFSVTVHFGVPKISGNIDWRFTITNTKS
jgi:hypothetical protein